jgi:hypothetical protein
VGINNTRAQNSHYEVSLGPWWVGSGQRTTFSEMVWSWHLHWLDGASPRQGPVTSSRYLSQNSHSSAHAKPIEALRREDQMPSSGHVCAIFSGRHAEQKRALLREAGELWALAMMQVADKKCGGVLRGACTDVCPTTPDSHPRVYSTASRCRRVSCKSISLDLFYLVECGGPRTANSMTVALLLCDIGRVYHAHSFYSLPTQANGLQDLR